MRFDERVAFTSWAAQANCTRAGRGASIAEERSQAAAIPPLSDKEPSFAWLIALRILHVNHPVILARPNQGDDPSNHTPAQEEIE